MNYILAILAGLVQGLSEFLPVSSTGHLIIFENSFGANAAAYFGLAFDASIHLGTLIAILIFFYRDYLEALKPKNGLLVKLIVGTIPAVVFGLLLESYIDSVFRQIWIVGAALIVFSFVMYFADKLGKQQKMIGEISSKQALVIGLFQSLALIPGVSRSGATISAGLLQNIKRQDAARFAFILSGPIVAAAGFKKLFEVLSGEGTTNGEISFLALGIISSAVFGYLTIKYFLKYLAGHSLKIFIIYRIVLGLFLIAITVAQKFIN